MRPLLLTATALLAASCDFLSDDHDPIRFEGETMGTTYSVTVVDVPDGATEETLRGKVEGVLAEVNGKMSNWDPESEVSQFNGNTSADPIPVSDEFAEVMNAANMVHELSGQKFDVTLAPLIDLWGFGPKNPGDPVPADADIATALELVGQGTMLTMSTDPAAITKGDPGVTINLSAIAKGYGVDMVAAALRADGVENYLVEIGGDLVTSGENAEGAPWSIAIERPDAETRTVELVVPVSGRGMATSGDYRNYNEVDGVRYSHIIDPTTGKPITHMTASVTVLAENAMMADALATAFLVVGAGDGLAIAEENEAAVLFITRDGEGFTRQASSAFESLSESD